MLDRTGDWCFEGGCSYLSATEEMGKSGLDGMDDLEAMYQEPCVGNLD